ncbi:penicillin-binding transpeptidase domain-containing protein [Nonomuraea longicatena]|uniref:penicillin-binding transpeptidase domain-containing protein n=1 Tax=Nonomuraea longicatena TaxID=83682 RepID=UPI0031D0FF1A
MRRRRLLAILVAIVAVTAASALAVAASRRTHGTAEQIARSYFQAWGRSDVPGMSALVHEAPSDFFEQHRTFSTSLGVDEIELKPGAVRATGEESAEVPFSGRRKLRALGWWEFESTLRLAVREGAWRVLWTPETLHPLLKDGGILEIDKVESPSVVLVTAEGEKFPADSYARHYLDRLAAGYPNAVGQALQVILPDDSVRRLISTVDKPKRQRTTLSRPIQAAAARALDGVPEAAIVAIRSSTGEVLAVADRLSGGERAFSTFYPPGSTFKVVVAAALLRSGLTPSDPVGCPAAYTVPFSVTIPNADDADRGTLPFLEAFAHSCNTSFVEQAVTRLGPEELTEVSAEWGFRPMTLPTGVGGGCGQLGDLTDPDNFGEAVIGGVSTVTATPLCMAAVAAAVESGVWRSPRLLPAKEAERLDGPAPSEVELGEDVAGALREMMSATVSMGTAAGMGLPEGTAGKTGTAEVAQQRSHAWLIGYRDDVAFAVFVRNGGSGRAAAVPIAARFLQGL